MRTPRSLRLFVALFAAMLVACGPIASIAHLVAVPHAVCEHGELVDLAGHDGPVAPVITGDSRRAAASPGQGALFGFDHDHCSVAASGRRVASHAGSPRIAIARLDIVVRTRTLARSAPPLHASVLSIAPKTSPPPKA